MRMNVHMRFEVRTGQGHVEVLRFIEDQEGQLIDSTTEGFFDTMMEASHMLDYLKTRYPIRYIESQSQTK